MGSRVSEKKENKRRR